tara:strand:- start:1381 stop:2130 length:750 start_codon:yes stop_codon:yes gene_type:complete
MFNNTKEPMVKQTHQVHTTTDYFLFKSIEGNRNKNLLHINRLKDSMAEKYLFTIIIVNEKYEIIDGQHRFEVIKELNLPMHYIICKGYGLNEVHILNQNSKTWNSDDYLEAYCNLKYPHYVNYDIFKTRYKLGHHSAMAIASNTASSPNGDHLKNFHKGEFVFKDFKKSCAIAEKIEILGQYYEGNKRRSFVLAMLQLFKNDNFEFTEFLQKLKNQPTALLDCANTSQYISLIEEIYNYRRKLKVGLRY